MISSRGHQHGIFYEARGNPGTLVMNKILYNTTLIAETFNVKIMLNMPRINIENTVRAKSIIKSGLSHRDVARVLYVLNLNIQIMAKYPHTER